MVVKHYPAEFKKDAVELFQSCPEAAIKQVAADLGINPETLRNWIRAAGAGRPRDGARPPRRDASQRSRVPGRPTGPAQDGHVPPAPGVKEEDPQAGRRGKDEEIRYSSGR
ncbi:transposase [Streptomyces noboritoensis]|uniref:Transposase n=1 Tax=Streptomyces noboritoensis TaxID=67337 RepID=A0ABV6TF81_9ACTN